jgi:hypothetical protein
METVSPADVQIVRPDEDHLKSERRASGILKKQMSDSVKQLKRRTSFADDGGAALEIIHPIPTRREEAGGFWCCCCWIKDSDTSG